MAAERIEMVVTVKAYPSISKRYGETVCVAGVRTDLSVPEWVRLFPVAFRDMHFTDRFKKYQRLTLDVTDASDPRPESVKPILDSIVPGDVIKPRAKWRDRRAIIEPLMLGSMCHLRELQRADGRSLGIFRPAEVIDFTWEQVANDWDDHQPSGMARSTAASFRRRCIESDWTRALWSRVSSCITSCGVLRPDSLPM